MEELIELVRVSGPMQRLRSQQRLNRSIHVKLDGDGWDDYWNVRRHSSVTFPNLVDLYTESRQTLQGSFSAGWLAGKPDYPQKLKVPEGYEKKVTLDAVLLLV